MTVTNTNVKALRNLLTALEKHADVANADKASVKQIEKATSRVKDAASQYLSSLPSKKALPNPFLDVVDDRLDDETRASLAAEWNEIVQKSKK
jgi:hypothetical protein